MDPKRKGKVAATSSGYCEANEEALSKFTREKADAIMAGKRKAARKGGVPQGLSKADTALCCSVITAIQASHEGSRTCTTAKSPTMPATDPEINCFCAAAAAAAVCSVMSRCIVLLGTHNNRVFYSKLLTAVCCLTCTRITANYYRKLQPAAVGGRRRVHQTETWIFASEDPAHNFDFHRHALTQIAGYYLDGPGSDATAAARKAQRTLHLHMFTNGCAKQSKGRRNFRFLADSVRQVGFIVEHHFAATSHFKGCHDRIGGLAKNAMKRAELYLIAGAAGVVKFLEGYFHHIGEGNKELADYFATWSPYRIRAVHVKLIDVGAIYRPEQQLKGIAGTRDAYLFVGANTAVADHETTTRRGMSEE